MEEANKTVLKLLIFIFYKFLIVSTQDYNYGLCSDPQCSVPVAEGVTVNMYHSPGDNKLSFHVNEELQIYVKDCGMKKDLLGVVMKHSGLRGYVPKTFVKETKSFQKALVSASIEFVQPQFMTNSLPMSSHLQESSNMHYSIQQSVPNNFDPHHSSQIFQQGDHIDHHSSQSFQDVHHSSPVVQIVQYSTDQGQFSDQGFQSDQFGNKIFQSGQLSNQNFQGGQLSNQNFQDGQVSNQNFQINQFSGQSVQENFQSDPLSGQNVQQNFQSYQPNINSFQSDQPNVNSFQSDQPNVNSFQSDQPNVNSFQSDQPNVNSFQSDQPNVNSFQSDQPNVNSFQSDQPNVNSFQSDQPNVNSFQSDQPNVNSFKSSHSDAFPLESSRQGENTHFHSSSNHHPVTNNDFQNFQSQTESRAQQSQHMGFSSREYMGPEIGMISPLPKEETPSYSESNVLQPSQLQQQQYESQSQSPPSFQSHHATHEVTGGNSGQNLNQQNNFYPSLSQTLTPQETTKTAQLHISQSSIKHMNQENDQDFDKTMAILKDIGYETDEYLTKPLVTDNIPESSVSSSIYNSHPVHQMKDDTRIHQSQSLTHPGSNIPLSNSNYNIQDSSSPNQHVHGDINKKPDLDFISRSSSATFSEHSQPGKPAFFENGKSRKETIKEKIAKHFSLIEESNAEEEEEEDDDEMDEDVSEDDLNEGLEKKTEDSESQDSISGQKDNMISEQLHSNAENILQVNSDVQNTHISASIPESAISSTNIVRSPSDFLQESEVPKKIMDDTNGRKLNQIKTEASNPTADKESNNIGILEKNDFDNLTLNKFEENKLLREETFEPLSRNNYLPQSDESKTLPIDLEINQTNINVVSDNIDDDFTFQNNEGNDSHAYSIDNSQIDILSENESDLLVSTDQSISDNLSNILDIKETESLELINAYQTRHLKDVESNDENLTPIEEAEQTISYTEFNLFIFLENSFDAVRSFVDALLPWIPDPLYTIIIDLEKKGISPKVPVFTALSAIPCVILIVLVIYIKEKSKEKKLIGKLTVLERNFYDLKEEKNSLEDKIGKMEVELQISRTMLEEEKILSFKSKTEVDSLRQQVDEINLELEKNVNLVDELKEREQEYIELVRDHEKEHLNLLEQKTEVENKLLNEESTASELTEQLQEKEEEVHKLTLEKTEFIQANEIYEEKLAQLQKNCNQLLQEAEVWNIRVNELTEKFNKEILIKEELEKSSKEKDSEIESLTQAVQIFKSFEEVGDDDEEEERKTNEEKLHYLINSSTILLKLQKQEEENKSLLEKLSEEKSKLLDTEVTVLDVKSENDKLKLNYNQALQDKAEAQTKLDVLTNYFKDKEIQLQKQLGVQEAVRQKTEKDATSAERRICLIEQENSSYKYQVATMKQEMEETERNLKSQIAAQEKKAHENWLAARTAERKLEDMKQEVMQLRQRLTLLEREQENWSNSTRDEIIRPVPKRISDDALTNQDSNSSIDLRPNIFPPPPMMLPSDRPLPPLPPLPPFLPPFEPPPFRPQHWHMPPPDSLSNSDYRMTPPDFGRGRESTPPRGRNSAVIDGDMGPRQSSPITDMRDSRNSTPPHLLPDFHDIPPHPPRPPFYPPMGPRSRFPMPPPPNFKREGHRRLDNQDESNSSFGSHHSSIPQDNWHNPNSRV